MFPTIVYIDCVFNSLVQNIVFNYVMPQRIPTDMLCKEAYPPTLTCKIARQLQNEFRARDDVFSFVYSVNLFCMVVYMCPHRRFDFYSKFSCKSNILVPIMLEDVVKLAFTLVGIRISVEQATISHLILN